MRLLPFDAHNHIHMGPSPPLEAIVTELPLPNQTPHCIMSGLAIMSTHPQDYDKVSELATTLPQVCPGLQVVPCFGVHPWFLHELDAQDWGTTCTADDSKDNDDNAVPRWLSNIEQRLLQNPQAIVGELGLDGFHFHADTGDLTTPMERQVEAFEAQMKLAAKLERPVSVHAVQCFGHMLPSLSKLKKKNQLPTKIYFHAFGGKLGTVDQLLALLCGKKKQPSIDVYFGFAPVVNFRSPKTFDVMRKVGLDRLVLETDHEDAALVPESLSKGLQLYAEALGVSTDTVIERTTQNARDLYGLQQQ